MTGARRWDGQLYWKRKLKAIQHRGGHCTKCGTNDPDVLHFHHTGKKRFALSQVFGDPSVTWKTIVEELERTALLCANDHIRHHAKERRDAWNKRQAKLNG